MDVLGSGKKDEEILKVISLDDWMKEIYKLDKFVFFSYLIIFLSL